MESKTFTAEIGGRQLEIGTGQLANQAGAAVTVRYGDTIVLATATMSKTQRDGIDFFPLMVDYEERLYAAGQIKSSRFMKREGRASDDAILTSRVVDRSIRPLFDDRMRNDIQVVITVLSWDQENDADILGMIGASAALHMSKIPWSGPIGAVRVGRVGGEWVLNPTYAAREKSDLEIILAATNDEHVMIEASGQEIDEQTMLDGLAFAHKHSRKVIELINQLQAACGQQKISADMTVLTAEEQAAHEALKAKVLAFADGKLRAIWKQTDKLAREEAILKLTTDLAKA
jgi:polyribonucleotide nucleotidyltransferase